MYSGVSRKMVLLIANGAFKQECMTIKLERIKAYKVILSTKHEIKLDSDEINSILEGIRSGDIIRIRQGLFNPSYFVAVIEDTERKERFLEDTKYGDEQSLIRRARGLEPLPNILEGTILRTRGEAKRLGAGD